MKGCLKNKSRSPSPGQDGLSLQCSHRKCVAFLAQREVHIADEWDRTPTYCRDLLELEEMQRSLPLANQPRDPLTGKRAEHYLSGVPIGLLPLLAMSDDCVSTSEGFNTPSPAASPRPSSPSFPSINCDTVEFAPVSGWNMNFHRSSTHVLSPASTYKASPHLVHLLPSRLRPNRQKPRFSFLPLLDTPSSSESSSPFPSNAPSRTPSPSHDGDLVSDTDQSFDPPTPSLTNASLDSSPYSRASSCSPEPPFLQLPSPPNTKPAASQGGGGGSGYVIGSNDSYFPPCDLFNNIPDIPSRFHQILPRDHSHAAMTRSRAMPNPITLIPPSPLTLPPVKAKKKRNIIVVNDVEIELDDEEEEPQVTMENTTGAIFPSNDIDERAATPTIEDVALSETKTNLIDDVRSDNLATGVSSSVPPPPLRTPTLSSSSFKPPSSSTGTVLVSPPRYTGSHRSKIHASYHYPSSSSASPSSSSPTLDLLSSPSTMNESVNLHIPIFFKRGMQSTSYGVNRSASH